MASLSTPNDDPERTMAQRKIIHLVEQATDNLPEAFRMVFVTRVIEGMSMEETSELLRINQKPFAEAELLLRNREVVSIPDRTSRTGAGKRKVPAPSNRSAAHSVARRIAACRSGVVLRALLRAAS